MATLNGKENQGTSERSKEKGLDSSTHKDPKRERDSGIKSERTGREELKENPKKEQSVGDNDVAKCRRRGGKENVHRLSRHNTKHRRSSKSKHSRYNDDAEESVRKKSERERSSSRREHRHRARDRIEKEGSNDERRKRKSRSTIESHRQHKDDRKYKGEHRSKKRIKADNEVETQKSLHPLGPVANEAPQTLLDPDADYFRYHPHLRLFLYRKYGLYFEDLSSEVARKEFQRFVCEYNAGNLEQVYYKNEPLPAEALDQCKRTKHEWKFNTTTKELESLNLVKEGVRKQTDYKKDGSDAMSYASRKDEKPKVEETLKIRNTDEKNKSSSARQSNYKTQEEIAAERQASRRLREHVLTAEEEFAVGEKKYYGIQQKQEKSRVQHFSNNRDQEAALAELDDKEIYGNGDEASFKVALAREKLRKAKQNEDKAARISDLEAKEKLKQAEMLKTLGLSNIQPGQKITIAPRMDSIK